MHAILNGTYHLRRRRSTASSLAIAASNWANALSSRMNVVVVMVSSFAPRGMHEREGAEGQLNKQPGHRPRQRRFAG
jgi:hypothetical protein